MQTETICIYHTKTGKTAFEVKRMTTAQGRESFSYYGTEGAGSCAIKDIAATIKLSCRIKRGIHLAAGQPIESFCQ